MKIVINTSDTWTMQANTERQKLNVEEYGEQSQKMYLFVPRPKINGNVGFYA